MKSMTGFGRGQARDKDVEVEIELRSVNHKGLDVKIKVPRELSVHEAQILERVRTTATRGRVDVSVRMVRDPTAHLPIFDEVAADRVLEQLRSYAAARNLPFDIGARDLMRAKELVTLPGDEVDPQALATATTAALDAALTSFASSRAHEGAALEITLLKHVAVCGDLVNAIEEHLQDAPEKLATRLRKRIASLDASVELDPVRLAQEVAILAEKADVTEEITRLRMHDAHARNLIAESSPSGRKLDFLCQEFLREANTIASKCQNAAASHVVVALKAEVEKLREQVQNIE